MLETVVDEEIKKLKYREKKKLISLIWNLNIIATCCIFAVAFFFYACVCAGLYFYILFMVKKKGRGDSLTMSSWERRKGINI